MEEPFKDKLPHLYTLIVLPDNSFEIRVDHKVINEGSLLSEFTPPVNPPREIDDPEDKKPEDWDEREKVSCKLITSFVLSTIVIHIFMCVLFRFQIPQLRNLKIGTMMLHHKFQTQVQ